jgi:hypothetical protein
MDTMGIKRVNLLMRKMLGVSKHVGHLSRWRFVYQQDMGAIAHNTRKGNKGR